LPSSFRPNLVVSSHAFEHISDPFSDLERLIDLAADLAIFCIEVPSFDRLLKSSRIDQIFHQHLHYFSEASIRALVLRLGCELLSIKYNYSTWGGTVFFSFRKPLSRNQSIKSSPNNQRPLSSSDFAHANQRFNDHLAELGQAINSSGFSYLGAAQMLPVLHYHIKRYIAEKQLLYVHDDNESRIDKFLPHVPVKVLPMDCAMRLNNPDDYFIIGAPDSSRTILKRTLELKLENIFSSTLLIV